MNLEERNRRVGSWAGCPELDGSNGRTRQMSDPTPRDQLAQIIYDTLNGQYGDFCMPDDAADAILAAGWRPPARVVTTVEELDALPDRSVIVAADYTILQCVGSGQPDWDGNVWCDEESRWWGSGDVTIPATVLYEPKEDA